MQISWYLRWWILYIYVIRYFDIQWNSCLQSCKNQNWSHIEGMSSSSEILEGIQKETIFNRMVFNGHTDTLFQIDEANQDYCDTWPKNWIYFLKIILIFWESSGRLFHSPFYIFSDAIVNKYYYDIPNVLISEIAQAVLLVFRLFYYFNT